jgi:hypothetical protein
LRTHGADADVDSVFLCRANYLGTQQLLKLASSMKQLESCVFVSTYYVNNFRPFNDHVQEEVHKLPLHLAGGCRTALHSLAACSWGPKSRKIPVKQHKHALQQQPSS